MLMDVWPAYMDSRLQQWMAKHVGVEFSATANDLAHQPMSDTKRHGIVAVLRGARTPPPPVYSRIEIGRGWRVPW